MGMDTYTMSYNSYQYTRSIPGRHSCERLTSTGGLPRVLFGLQALQQSEEDLSHLWEVRGQHLWRRVLSQTPFQHIAEVFWDGVDVTAPATPLRQNQQNQKSKKNGPHVDAVVGKGMQRVVEVSADPDVDVAHVRLGHLPDAPLVQGVLQLAGGQQEVSDGGGDVPESGLALGIDILDRSVRLWCDRWGSMTAHRGVRTDIRRGVDGCCTGLWHGSQPLGRLRQRKNDRCETIGGFQNLNFFYFSFGFTV